MSEVIGDIADAIEAVLTAAMPEIDASSANDFLPAVSTVDTALILPVFGQQSEFGTYNLNAGSNYQSHRLRVELWIKHQGDVSDTTERTRVRIAQAVRALRTTPDLDLGDSYEVSYFDGRNYDPTIEASVADEPIEVAGVPFILATLIVPVTKFD